ncbi:astacin-like metalloendopeptidase, partial [Gopherus evgoodei]|uniref:astacin-like metalloendopeptidase n=2 Tax=Testudinidae TaxID=8487 RepID=UPI0011CF9123
SDEILNINQELIPPEAPASSFLLEGDIVKVSPFRVFSSASPKWPKRRGTVQIPYIISYKYDKPSVKIIKEAFADFARFTCIKFVPYSYQRDFISIMPMSGCFSSVGRTGGMQVVSLAPACLRRGKGVTLHELMHVLGFWHEHSRADRDKYIRISWNEILTGFEINFMKSWNSNMLVDYDYSSVMHYGRYAFSMTGLPTIIPLSNPFVALGQRRNLSSSDIARVNKLYKCSPTLTESGGYISLKSPSARQTTGHKTSLISPILHRIGCIHFWYSPLGSVMGTINIYIKLADAPEWHRIWSAKGKQGRDWHQVGVETSVSQKLQVMVEGVIGPDAGSDVGIDDLSVCVAECQGGCDELIALYKK